MQAIDAERIAEDFLAEEDDDPYAQEVVELIREILDDEPAIDPEPQGEHNRAGEGNGGAGDQVGDIGG